MTWDERENEAKKSKRAYWNKLAVTLVEGKELSLEQRQQLEKGLSKQCERKS